MFGSGMISEKCTNTYTPPPNCVHPDPPQQPSLHPRQLHLRLCLLHPGDTCAMPALGKLRSNLNMQIFMRAYMIYDIPDTYMNHTRAHTCTHAYTHAHAPFNARTHAVIHAKDRWDTHRGRQERCNHLQRHAPINQGTRVRVCVCVCVCACVCVCVWMYVYVHVCSHACVRGRWSSIKND